MTPEAQNIAIAESLGYKRWCQDCAFSDAPNYHSSLDACAEFEAKLKENGARWVTYCNTLALLCGGLHTDDGGSFVSHMTAIDAPPNQRCEAYLRTLNLWKESK